MKCAWQIFHAIELFDYIPPECAPKICNGTHVHDQALWREFFVTLELFRKQCVSVGQDLVSVMNEIRLTDSLGMPSRRQLYSQHRALSRALMDSELQCLRRKGQITLTRLQSLAKSISSNDKLTTNQGQSGETTTAATTTTTNEYSNRHVSHRLKEVTAIFEEVDRATRRLEQLTEQRRERLREITRQKALEEEIREVSFVCFSFSRVIERFEIEIILKTEHCNDRENMQQQKKIVKCSLYAVSFHIKR